MFATKLGGKPALLKANRSRPLIGLNASVGVELTNRAVRWPIIIAGAAVLMFALKVAVAYNTYGTNDVLTWSRDLLKIQSAGTIGLYREGVGVSSLGAACCKQEFIHPPFMIHVLQIWGFIAAFCHTSLGFQMRVSCAFADLGSLFVVWNIRKQLPGLGIRPVHVLLMTLSPVSVEISGFHGNTDPIMIFFAVLAVYCVESKRPAWIAGAIMGIAMSIKIVPVIFIPAAVFCLPGMKARVQFCIATLSVFALSGAPVIFSSPALIIGKLVGYNSLPGIWGFSQVGMLLGKEVGFSKQALLVAIVGLSAGMAFSRPRLSLFVQCGLIASTFLFFTPGFGVQYLTWLVPWLASLALYPPIVFNITAGTYLFAVYTYWSGGFPWYFADSFGKVPAFSESAVYLGVICWLAVGATLVGFAGIWLSASRAGAGVRSTLAIESGNVDHDHEAAGEQFSDLMK